MTYYEVLEVGEKSSNEVISAAYKALAKKYHPDVNNDSDAASMMKLINEAFEILSNPDKRQQYDEYLHDQRKRSTEEERARQDAENRRKAEEARAEQERKVAEKKAKEAAEAKLRQQESCYKKASELSKKQHLTVKSCLKIAELFEQAGQYSDSQLQADTFRRLAQKKYAEKNSFHKGYSHRKLPFFVLIVVVLLLFLLSPIIKSLTNSLTSDLYFVCSDTEYMTVGGVWRIPYHSELNGKSDSDIVWTSSDNSIATVKDCGKVTAMSKGEVQISISLDGITKDTCTIIVS